MERFESFIGVDFFTALFVLLNTLIIFLVAKKYLTGPIMGLIEKRQKEVDDAYARAKQAEDEAGALREEYTARLAEAKQTISGKRRSCPRPRPSSPPYWKRRTGT